MDHVPPPREAVGYFAVIIPQQALWQGFYLVPRSDTDKIIAQLRNTDEDFPDSDEPRIGRTTPGVALEDQTVFGAATAALLDRVAARDMFGIAVLAPTVAKLARTNYFWVEGRIEANGTHTVFDRLPVASIEAARTAIRQLPAVTMLETMKLLKKKP